MKDIHHVTVDKESSQQIARMLDSRRNPSYHNLLKALRWVPELQDAHYVEGWVVTLDDNKVSPHGWIELKGRIVDPIHYTKVAVYFPAVRLDQDEVAKAFEVISSPDALDEHRPLFAGANLSDMDGTQLAQSRLAAHVFARTLAKKMNWMYTVTSGPSEPLSVARSG